MSKTRRQFFAQVGLLSAGSAIAVPRLALARPARGQTGSGGPRHIIHLVADGMSSGTLTLADHYSLMTRQRRLTWFKLSQRPSSVLAMMDMSSLNSIVTDSAAASSSWGSGCRVANGALNLLPDGTRLSPLCSIVGEASWKRGLVTTTEITHATPAGFAASLSSRGEADTIAEQYLGSRIEVLLGGGKKYFDQRRKDKRDLLADYRGAGYVTLETASELESASLNRRWLGTFASSHLPFSIDLAGDAAARRRIPTLARMTERALEKLQREDHFLLQVEGGRVDHAAHACDIATAIHDLIAFDEALDVALEFQGRFPDTLLVVTTDHGTGNPGLNGMGDGYGRSTSYFANVVNVKRSFESLSGSISSATTAQQVRSLLEEATGWAAPEAKAAQFAEFIAGKWQPLLGATNSAAVQLGMLLGNYLGVGWSSGAHTADYSPLIANGPGAERFRGFLQNTDVFGHYMDLAGIDFRNSVSA